MKEIWIHQRHTLLHLMRKNVRERRATPLHLLKNRFAFCFMFHLLLLLFFWLIKMSKLYSIESKQIPNTIYDTYVCIRV